MVPKTHEARDRVVVAGLVKSEDVVE